MSAEKTDRPPRYITPQGFRRLAEEHGRIWTELRPRIVAEVEAAAALGDRSENAEYIYGKKKLRELDRRLRFLSEKMDSLTVVEPKPHPSGKAYFGAWVVVADEDGEERAFRLVGADETDAASGCISVEAPLGRALLGKAEGDEARVQRPAGTAVVMVVEVRWSPPERWAPGPVRRPARPRPGRRRRRART
jgi:transcription elongation factor GreB